MALAMLAAACGSPPPSQADFTDALYWNGIHYTVPYASVGRQLSRDDLDVEMFLVKNKLSKGPTRPPLPTFTDRDAAFIPAGAPVFAVKGYKATFRLAAEHDGRLVLYESTPSAAAHRGADLLDIEGRVISIALLPNTSDSYAPMARLEDRTRIDDLVRSISVAPVDLSPPWGVAGSGGRFVFIAFELADGTRTVRGYNDGLGALADVIYVDESFRTAIDQLMRSSPCGRSCWP